MSCDFILPPCFADYFSVSSVRGMLWDILPSWFAWNERVCAAQNMAANDPPAHQYTAHTDHFLYSNNKPRVLPFIVMNYGVSGPYIINGAAIFFRTLQNMLQDTELPQSVAAQLCSPPPQMVVMLLRYLGTALKMSEQMGVPVVNMNGQTIHTHFRVRSLQFFPRCVPCMLSY